MFITLKRTFAFYLLHYCFFCSAAAINYHIYTSSNDVYQVTYSDLSKVQSLPKCVPKSHIKLSYKSSSHKYWLKSKNEEVFCSGDSLIFKNQYDICESEEHDIPTMQLTINEVGIDGLNKLTQQDTNTVIKLSSLTINDSVNSATHRICEQKNKVRIPLSKTNYLEDGDIWYWAKIHSGMRSPFNFALKVDDIFQGNHPVKFKIKFRSLSHANQVGFLHKVDIKLNDKSLGHAEWSGTGVYEHVIDFQSSFLNEGHNQFSLSLIHSKNKTSEQSSIDVVYLDGVEIEYIDGLSIDHEQKNLNLKGNQTLNVTNDAGQYLEIFSLKDRVQIPISTSKESYQINFDSSVGKVTVVKNRQYKSPVKITQNTPLINIDPETDYLIISHPKFIDGIQVLKTFHEINGSRVTLLDTQSIYDQLSFGLVSAKAIAQIIRNVYDNGAGKLQNVLIVGDSNWLIGSDILDLINGHDSIGFIPSWQTYNKFGVGASDSKYADINDDGKPDIPIGRLAVNNNAELDAMIKKIMQHHEQINLGSWKTKFSMLTDGSRASLAKNQRIITRMPIEQQLKSQLMIDHNNESVSVQQSVINAFNEGEMLVHFYGHGGRYMWDLGVNPKEQKKQFFEMEHVSQLQNKSYPVLLMMTCAAGPFDHPNTNSIAELFMTAPGAGAVAVISSSTRNAPKKPFSRLLINELMRGSSVGEALLSAKREVNDPLLTEAYNLLGDPAVKLKLPQYKLALSHDKELGVLDIKIPFKADSSEIFIEEFNDEMELIQIHNITTDDQQFSHKFNANTKHILMYAFNKKEKTDGVGYISI